MKLVSVNVSLPREVVHEGRKVRTGIFKSPVAGRVRMGRSNLEGDGQADSRVHGGEYMAVYAYPLEHYAFWAHELGRDELPHGQFGENLTVQGMTEDTVHVGDVFRVGDALVQVTQPRVPCFKLGLRMGLPEFPERFLASERSGYYLRVVEEGTVAAGDPIELVRADPAAVSVRRIHRLRMFDKKDHPGIRAALRCEGLSPGWRQALEKLLPATSA